MTFTSSVSFHMHAQKFEAGFILNRNYADHFKKEQYDGLVLKVIENTDIDQMPETNLLREKRSSPS